MRLPGFLAAFAALFLAACNPVAATEGAEAQIAQFQKRFKSGDLDAIWRTTHPEFRKLVKREQLSVMLSDFREILGELESTDRQSINVNSTNGTTTVEIVMRSQFANGEALETFGYREQGERWMLINYVVQSPLIDDYDFSKLESDGLIYEAAPEAAE